LAAPADAPVRPEPVAWCEPDIIAAASRFAYCPKKTGGILVLLDPEAPLDFAGDEHWIFYPGLDLPSSEWYAAAQTYTRLQCLATIPKSGVAMVQALILISEPSPDIVDPLWREPISDFARLGVECLPSGFSAAFVFATPVVVASRLHAYLRRCGKEQDDGLAA